MKDDNIIYVIQTGKNTALLKYKNIETQAFIGKNGLAQNKEEGDGKTPIGKFGLGLIFGLHRKEELNLNAETNYIKLTDSMYWVSDSKSKYYNKFVDTTKIVNPDWEDAEHLIDYKVQYEYAIEIKSNSQCIPKKGSAIFIHCENKKPTEGCVSIKREKMIELLNVIDNDTKIEINAS